jgi:hypothetical protein
MQGLSIIFAVSAGVFSSIYVVLNIALWVLNQDVYNTFSPVNGDSAPDLQTLPEETCLYVIRITAAMVDVSYVCRYDTYACTKPNSVSIRQPVLPFIGSVGCQGVIDGSILQRQGDTHISTKIYGSAPFIESNSYRHLGRITLDHNSRLGLFYFGKRLKRRRRTVSWFIYHNEYLEN